jgi:Asparagine synthase/Glutamine amidotransferase domain
VGALLAEIALDWQKSPSFLGEQIAQLKARAAGGIHQHTHNGASLIWTDSGLARDQVLLGQPWKDRDLCLIFDGILFNRAQLTKQLKLPSAAREFAILVTLWRRYGEKMLSHMDGEFVLVLIDFQAQTALIARDRLGARALFWRIDATRLRVANEAFWLTDARPEINTLEIAKFFGVQNPSPDATFFQGVHKLRGGSALLLNGPRIRQFNFASVSIQVRPRMDPIEAMTNVRALISQSIDKRVPDHNAQGVPTQFATSLSGGLDSNIIFALADQQRPKQQSAISWRFDALRDCEESNFAKLHAAARALNFYDFAADSLQMFSNPSLRHTSLNSPFNHPYRELLTSVRITARDHQIEHVLHGAYGDNQFFAASEVLSDLWDRKELSALSKQLLIEVSRQVNPLKNISVRRLLRRLSHRKLRTIGNFYQLSAFAKALLSEPAEIGSFRDWQIESCLGAHAQFNGEVDCEYDERVGVHTIYPLRDWDLMHFMLSLPVDFGHRAGTTKWIWRQMMARDLPPGILHRPKSTSMTPFFQAGMGHHRSAIHALLLNPEADWQRYLDRDFGLTLLDRAADQFAGATLWRCISYELWRCALGLRQSVPGLF